MSAADKQTINELRRLGGLVKHLYTEGKVHPDRSAEALRELIAAVKRIGKLRSVPSKRRLSGMRGRDH